MPRFEEEHRGGIADRLRCMNNQMREEVWPKLSTDDRKALWMLPPSELYDLLPRSEQLIRSRCCCAVISWTWFMGEKSEPRCGNWECQKVITQIHEPVGIERGVGVGE